MKILVFCYEYPPIGGGGGIGAQQYAEAWARQGHHVTVITSCARGLFPKATVNGVEVIRVTTVGRKDRATATLLSMLCYNATAFTYVLSHSRTLREFQVINTHFSIPTGPVAWVAARFLGLPNVLTIIGGDIYDPSKRSSPHRSVLMRLANRWIINGADRVVAISTDTKKRAEHFYKVRRPIGVINYGFKPSPPENENLTVDPLDPGKFYLIAVGRLVKRKGFEFLVRALKQLPGDVVLLLVGDGPLEFELRRLSQQEGVTDRVRMLGFLTREQIYMYLRKADCYVLPSLHEGLGIVVQEAMDAGLPVIATNDGGQVDLIKYPRNGILVETGNTTALAEAIRRLYDDRGLAKLMGQNNLVDIARLHIDINCRLYLDLFEELSALSILSFSCKTT